MARAVERDPRLTKGVSMLVEYGSAAYELGYMHGSRRVMDDECFEAQDAVELLEERMAEYIRGLEDGGADR